eukprot:TRINITY_DN3490_c0_g1_i2.p1 TRINITY_DN3490_c0_g1~~TRINITY_DN3490_c0_g1_i2.p1  ORF type:complete len:328 (-),score=61.57 TRINITY_DN3490_c0_g1_i2:26-1009(-)
MNCDHMWIFYFTMLFIRCLVHGNMTKQDSLDICSKSKETLKFDSLSEGQEPDNRIVKLENGHTYIYTMDGSNPDDVNSAICNAYMIGPYTTECGVLLTLLGHMANQPCYEQLRTVEQLGYIVWSGVQNMSNILCYRVIVQSSDKEVEYLNKRIERFLKQYRKELDEMSEEKFETSKDAVIKLILEKEKKLSETTQRFWSEIATRQYLFDRAQQEAETLRGLHLEDLKHFFDRYIAMNAPERRKFSSRSVGKKEDNKPAAEPEAGASASASEEADAVENKEEDTSHVVNITNFNDFKAGMGIYPNFAGRRIDQTYDSYNINVVYVRKK